MMVEPPRRSTPEYPQGAPLPYTDLVGRLGVW
jgi:hypothetical protein